MAKLKELHPQYVTDEEGRRTLESVQKTNRLILIALFW